MKTLSGIIPPVVTPLKATDQLDVEAVDRLVDHLWTGGVDGLFVLGTTGEGPSLSHKVRCEMVERTCHAAAGRVPVLVGVTDTSLAESIQLAEHAADCGAHAVVAAAPFYFPVTQEQCVSWFGQLADASPLPVLLYNMPGCVEVSLELETVRTLSNHENIIGVKDSAGDLPAFRALCDEFAATDFLVFMGPEELIPEAVAAGADGGVCGGGNLLPEVYVRLYQAAIDQNDAEVSRLNGIVRKMYQQIYHDQKGCMNIIAALKLAMSRCGLCEAVTCPPLLPPHEEHVRQIDASLPEILKAANADLSVSLPV